MNWLYDFNRNKSIAARRPLVSRALANNATIALRGQTKRESRTVTLLQRLRKVAQRMHKEILSLREKLNAPKWRAIQGRKIADLSEKSQKDKWNETSEKRVKDMETVGIEIIKS